MYNDWFVGLGVLCWVLSVSDVAFINQFHTKIPMSSLNFYLLLGPPLWVLCWHSLHAGVNSLSAFSLLNVQVTACGPRCWWGCGEKTRLRSRVVQSNLPVTDWVMLTSSWMVRVQDWMTVALSWLAVPVHHQQVSVGLLRYHRFELACSGSIIIVSWLAQVVSLSHNLQHCHTLLSMLLYFSCFTLSLLGCQSDHIKLKDQWWVHQQLWLSLPWNIWIQSSNITCDMLS